MTRRGIAGNPAAPPLPPQDPTLQTRPVPRQRLLPHQSLGPGAAPDIRSLVEPIEELEARIGPESYDAYSEVLDLLRIVGENESLILHEDETALDDPTWGFFVFLTSYSTDALENLAPAVTTVTEILRRNFSQRSHPDFAAEAHKRFKLDIVQDKNAREDASDDRVREEFNSRIRGLRLWPDEEDDPCGPLSPGRFVVCLVLDEATILQLAGLSFPEGPNDDYKAFEGVAIKIIDRVWERPENGRGSYPGVDACPVQKLDQVYIQTSAGDSGAMMDMYPTSKRHIWTF
ncbi:hypothetical protein FGRMN_9937 [Fusarium graminum]|nr:hypothetical protein FGRMN_9937 [Fusarium graminum]